MAWGTRRIVTAGVAALAVVGSITVAVPASAATAVTVTSISPTSGPTTGGTRVTVNGTGFTHVSRVMFGANTGLTIHVVTSTRLLITAPPHSAGPVDVRVVTDHGTSPAKLADHYRYKTAIPTVTSVTPNSGPAAGGTRVTLLGTNFMSTTHVFFGATQGTIPHVVSSTRMLITSPAGTPGLVDVRVVTAGGTSAATTADRFTYLSGEVAPVTGLTAAGATVNTVTLVWTPSTSGDVTGLTIRRAAGTTPPASPTDGAAVADDVAPTTAFFVDQGLDIGATYSYAVFAHNAADANSAAATVTTATQRTAPFGPFSTNANGLTDVSCINSSVCVGVQGSDVQFLKNATFQTPQEIATGDTLTSISCVTNVVFCVALGGAGAYVYDATQTWSVATQIGAGGYTDVSCTAATFCMAVDPDGSYATFDGSDWTTADGPTNNVVSCATSTACAAVDSSGRATYWTGTDWTTLARRAGSAAYEFIDCSSASFCELLDTAGGVTALVNGVLGTLFPIGGFNDPQGIACLANTALCTAVDSQGRVATSNGTQWSAGTPVASGAPATTFAIDCTTDQFCILVAGSGGAFEMVG